MFQSLPISILATGLLAAGLGAKEPTAKQPAAVRQKDYGVRLSSANTLEELRLSWSTLNEAGGEVLAPLKPRYQKGAGNAPYQLVAGPFKSEADAARACQALAQKGLSCAPTSFAGQGL